MRKNFLKILILMLISGPFSWAGKYNCSNINGIGNDKSLKDLRPLSLQALQSSKITGNKIIISKQWRTLYLFKDDTLLRSYSVALGDMPYGPKMFAGDGKTPEGLYRIDFKKVDSDYHRALHISYPAQKDIENAKKYSKDLGFEFSTGGDIMIHGFPNGREAVFADLHPLVNWTRGCVAVTNDEIDNLFALVPEDTEIEICPATMYHPSH